MRVVVTPERIEATPGVPQQLQITITNPGTLIGGYTVRLLGVDPTWVVLDSTQVSLFPEETCTVEALVTIPVGLVAGDRRMAVQVRELTPPGASAVEEVVLVVPEARNLDLVVDPIVLTAGRAGRFSLLVDNTGNTPLLGRLTAHDPEAKLQFSFTPARLDLAPGEHVVVDLLAKGPRPLLGAPLVRMIEVHLDEDGVSQPVPVTEDRLRVGKGRTSPPPPADAVPLASASLVQKARFPRGVFALLGLLAAITVFAVVITVALSRIVDESTADRDLALKVAAAQDGDGAGVGSSSLAGTVRNLTTGAPVEGAMVSVFAADDLARAVRSDVTDDTGAYAVAGLSAGDYKLTYRAAGLVQQWFPAAIDSASASSVALEADNAVAGLDVALGGVPATISGTVIGDDVSDATITLVTTAPAPAPGVTTPPTFGSTGATGDGATVQTVPVGAGGVFVLGDVPSPAVYDVVVAKEGYASSTQRIDVTAGEDRKGVEINLTKGNGVISGRVVSAGVGVGDVLITATAGDTTVTARTRTDGQAAGQFVLRQLPTPQAYTIVASGDGLASQTIVVSLGDDQTIENLQISLSSASGGLRGRATALDGTPLGGVTVAVTDGGTTVQTATRSSAGNIGTWSVEGLAIPGTYTVTLSRSDLVSQTVSVTLDQFGTVTSDSSAGVPLAEIVTTMRPSTAVIEGVVLQPSRDPEICPANINCPVGEVTVTVSSGVQTYSMTTATRPDGDKGRFRLEGIVPGTYTVSLSRPGVTPTSAIVSVVAGQTLQLPADLAQLELPARVRGTVLDAEGQPVGAGYVVELYRANDYPGLVYRTVRTQAGGTFFFDDVDAPETYVVQVRRAPGGAPLGSNTVRVPLSGDPNVTVRLRNE